MYVLLTYLATFFALHLKFFTLAEHRRPETGDRTRKSFYILSDAAMQCIGQTIIIVGLTITVLPIRLDCRYPTLLSSRRCRRLYRSRDSFASMNDNVCDSHSFVVGAAFIHSTSSSSSSSAAAAAATVSHDAAVGRGHSQ